ncbi:MAG: hypothetical protein A2076_16185 [Geobacteraceae bacterium GWC2_53_11]|nr:MAG: hypothetical protein A2076_16185 [Geobacteraceae bacterium GWC2_53_11]
MSPDILLSEKFGILRSDKQLKIDFEAYQIDGGGLGLIFFDIDHFKPLNTKYTETVVDKDILAPFQRQLSDLVCHRGFAYSVGGDEFIILLLGVNQEETLAFANRLLETARNTVFKVKEDDVNITLSAGVANDLSDSRDYQTLRELANQAENKAKANGRNQVVFSGQDLTATEAPKESEQQGIVKVFPESTVFFYERFCSAFPGVRGIQWFANPDEAIIRLSKLLRPPLSLTKDKHSGTLSPIWWWRDGNLHIRKFGKVKDEIVLLDWFELKIDKVAAVNSGSYYQCFVYVQTSPFEPTGLYPRTEEEIKWCVDTFGYCSEEYGLFDNQYKVTRAEYDDDAAMINGELIDFEGNIELRIRHITPYNFIIAAQNSPINNSRFDQTLKQLMNNLLQGKTSLEHVEEAVSKLSKREPRG